MSLTAVPTRTTGLPTPPQPGTTDLEATRQYLAAGVQRILIEPDIALDVQSYMNMHTAVVRYCHGSHPKGSKNRSLYGDDLYLLLAEHVGRYTRDLAQTSKSHQGEALLQYYLEEWQRFQESAKLINRVFQYLNRHWFLREADEGKRVPQDVYILCLVQWYTGFYSAVSEELTDCVTKLPESCRKGAMMEPSRLEAAVQEITPDRRRGSFPDARKVLSNEDLAGPVTEGQKMSLEGYRRKTDKSAGKAAALEGSTDLKVEGQPPQSSPASLKLAVKTAAVSVGFANDDTEPCEILDQFEEPVPNRVTIRADHPETSKAELASTREVYTPSRERKSSEELSVKISEAFESCLGVDYEGLRAWLAEKNVAIGQDEVVKEA